MKKDSDQSSQLPRDQTETNCFFKACDREASEKLLRDAYTYSI